tara:strand:+ start:2007 stop:2498 length:492 start_codon:yes stop_codon:yes gene_type:complete
MVFVIYKINKVNYIGCTKNLKKRFCEHRYRINNPESYQTNKELYDFIRENNIKLELIPLFFYKKELKHKRIARLVEQWYINLFDSKNNGFNNYSSFAKIPSSKFKNIKSKQKNLPLYNKYYRESLPPKYCFFCKHSYPNKYKYKVHLFTNKHIKNVERCLKVD